MPFPYTITTFQFASGSFFITLMWLLNLHPRPRLSPKQVVFCCYLLMSNHQIYSYKLARKPAQLQGYMLQFNYLFLMKQSCLCHCFLASN